MSSLRALVMTLRPHQWVKNLFVAAPLVFSKRLTDPHAALVAALAVGTFCALSGAVYALNDVIDVDRDRAHPTKRLRPVARGALSVHGALAWAALLAGSALAVAFGLGWYFFLIAAGYLGLNLAYSLRLKEIAYLDVMCIAAGFLLRVLGGAFAIGVEASIWLLSCTGLLAALLGLGKRTHELALAHAQAKEPGGKARTTRAVLARYKAGHLRVALVTLAFLTSISYVLYTRAVHTIEFFGTTRMLWTAPFCFVGIMRFLALVTRHPQGESPTDQMLRDVPFMANLAIWGMAVLFIIYFAP
ncbi:MAG: UbiA prenyltransferase family protein [Deltaproteobacteria bacterium]|nr:UbiA prenyltransferase family protein [Deltaproteobacteria bacterium]